jgi:3-hydroxyisobutyrate dehydrogenase
VAQAPDLATLVSRSDVLILSLFDDAAVAEMLDALLRHDLSGRLILETSTVVPQILIERADAFAKKGRRWPTRRSRAGRRWSRRAPAASSWERSPRSRIGRSRCWGITPRVLHMGPLGAGMVMKTINNGMIQIYGAGLTEMLRVAKRAGIALEDVLTVLNAGPAGTDFIRARTPKIVGEDPSVGFTLNGVLKDNGVFRRVAEGFGAGSQTLEIAGRQQAQQVEDGLGEQDLAAGFAVAYGSA